MMVNSKQSFEEQILCKLQDLIAEAKSLGYVIQIDIKSKEPLAMGNYDMIPSARKAKHVEYMSLELLQDLASLNKRITGLRVYECGKDYMVATLVEDKLKSFGFITEDQFTKYLKGRVNVS